MSVTVSVTLFRRGGVMQSSLFVCLLAGLLGIGLGLGLGLETSGLGLGFVQS